MKPVFDYGYAVRFLQQLQHIIKVKQVHELVLHCFSKNTVEPADIYQDVWDCQFIKSNPVFRRTLGRCLGVQLYFDGPIRWVVERASIRWPSSTGS